MLDEKEPTGEGREDTEIKEEKVVFPETHRREAVFLGKQVSLRPLPVLWAKRLNRAFDTARKYLAPEAKDDDLADESAANAYISAAAALCECYRMGLAREYIEENATLSEIMAFCDAQAALQEENDFLLWRLRGYTTVTKTIVRLKAGATDSLSSLSLPASPNPTEDSTLSLEPTPADSSD